MELDTVGGQRLSNIKLILQNKMEMISIEEFIVLLEEEFEDLNKGFLKPDSKYRDIPNFSSMHALVLIALVDNKFDVLLNGADLKSTESVLELYNLIQSKLNK